MSKYPEMTDDAGWTRRKLERYRGKSRFNCLVSALVLLPFCFIWWCAQEGQCALQALTEYRPQQEEKAGKG